MRTFYGCGGGWVCFSNYGWGGKEKGTVSNEPDKEKGGERAGCEGRREFSLRRRKASSRGEGGVS